MCIIRYEKMYIIRYKKMYIIRYEKILIPEDRKMFAIVVDINITIKERVVYLTHFGKYTMFSTST